MLVAIVDDVVVHVREERRPPASEHLGHVEPGGVQPAIIRGEQLRGEADLREVFRRGQFLNGPLHQPVDIFLAGAGGEDRSEGFLESDRQLLKVIIACRRGQPARLVQTVGELRNELPQQLRPSSRRKR